MLISDFDYELPESFIAKTPASPRDSARLLVVDRLTGTIAHHKFSDLGLFLRPDDLLVLNDTKVLPARIAATSPFGGKMEIFLLNEDPEKSGAWHCLVRPGRRVREGITVDLPGNIQAVVTRVEEGLFSVSFPFASSDLFLDWLFQHGESPLPPYLKREATPEDKEEYQTVYAKRMGSVAAPTAGLHFTTRLLESLRRDGVRTIDVTLHVGYGTFAPLREESFQAGELHPEIFRVSPNTVSLLKETRAKGARIIPVGTTSLRTLESLGLHGESGTTRIFIKPGDKFQWTDGLITNFHLPRSSLYVLVCALLGVEKTRAVYDEAKEKGYRFYSYGDAMLIL